MVVVSMSDYDCVSLGQPTLNSRERLLLPECELKLHKCNVIAQV